jgi:peptide/nickel transport system permease protein
VTIPMTPEAGAPVGITPDAIPSASGSAAFRRFAQAVLRNRKATAGLVILAAMTLIALFPQLFTNVDPQAAIFDQQAGPSAQHLLGTTQVGEDVFAQVIWGTRLTLLITVIVSLAATVISVLIGVTAAYVGGMADRSLSLLTDVFLVLPTLPLLIVLTAYLPSGSLTITAVMIATSWAFAARQLRAQGLSLRTRDFLEAAKVRGERRSYIIVVEILPNMISLLVASFLGLAVFVVGFAAGLQFLGLGNSTELTWGTMLYYSQQNGALESGNALWMLAPGAAVAILGTGFALLNYAFDEIGNPALRPVRRRRVKPTA